jgi:hypothetical protein
MTHYNGKHPHPLRPSITYYYSVESRLWGYVVSEFWMENRGTLFFDGVPSKSGFEIEIRLVWLPFYAKRPRTSLIKA